MAPVADSCAGVILAGGRSSRMGGGYKALAELGGRPMVQHVMDRLRGQAEPLLLSVATLDECFRDLGLTLVPDRVASHRGPLAGLCSALEFVAGRHGPEWLLLCPCDAPFLPPDLAVRLLAAVRATGRRIATARYGGRRQPTFSLWHAGTLGAVTEVLSEKAGSGLTHVLDQMAHAVVDWPEQCPPPFYNVNTPEELAQAQRWL